MNRAHISMRAWLGVMALLTMLAPRLARGDGGVVQLHQAQGPFLVTVFVSPEAVRGAPVDLSVLVQWRTNGEVVLDADVSLAVDPPDSLAMARSEPLCAASSAPTAFPSADMSHPATVRATREQAFEFKCWGLASRR